MALRGKCKACRTEPGGHRTHVTARRTAVLAAVLIFRKRVLYGGWQAIMTHMHAKPRRVTPQLLSSGRHVVIYRGFGARLCSRQQSLVIKYVFICT